MRMPLSRGGPTHLPMQGGGFGRLSQQRSIEELVKHDQGLDREPRPPRRGCGCAVLPLVGLAIGIPFLSRLT
jgi:hypothetical protein